MWSVERWEATAVVILDLSAALNTVDHDLLLNVLENKFRIGGQPKEWYRKYLKPRKFKVKIGDSISKSRQLDYLVPQGSVQGTFLFIVYMATLEDVVPSQLELNGFTEYHSVKR